MWNSVTFWVEESEGGLPLPMPRICEIRKNKDFWKGHSKFVTTAVCPLTGVKAKRFQGVYPRPPVT